jgi:cytochrome b6-f complex iron-sulfur subunit
MDRRKFIQRGCTACMGLAGLGFLIDSCSPKLSLAPVQGQAGDDRIKVLLSDFGNNDHLVVRNNKLSKDILLVKKDNQYKALYMECTHFNFGLSLTGNKLVCNAHGSQFDLDGNVIQEPAQRNLKQFKTEVINSAIIIHLT